jgi:chorismate dehydratase
MVVKISCVSYLNSRPFIYGLRKADFLASGEAELSLDDPAACAAKVLKKEADIGLVPVAILPQLKGYKRIADAGISANGKVGSVMLYSEVPLNQIKEIWLDNESRTSVMLTKILAKELWKMDPLWKEAVPGYEKKIKGNTAGVVIGDRALDMLSRFPYEFDLAEAWKELTGLPFVFACWVASPGVPQEFILRFEKAIRDGITELDSVIALSGNDEKTKNYLKNNIHYPIGTLENQGLQRFLSYLASMA